MPKVKAEDKAKKTEEPEEEKKEEPEEEKKEEKKEEEEGEEDSPIVKQLKELDDKYLALQKEFEREAQKLQNEYTKRQKPFLEDRKKVLTAPPETGPSTGTPAVSGFWLKAMQNHPIFSDSIQEWDEPVLEFLSDIEKFQNEEDSTKGFKLTFHFSENPYFENTELTKEYTSEETNPYCGEIEVKEVKSTTIDWKSGKNVTVEKTVKKVKGGGAKKQKQKGKEKEEARPSFFREFFRNLKPGMELMEDAKQQALSIAEEEDDDEDCEDDDLIQYLLESDHDTGTALRDLIIPFAVRWYTGEAAPDYDPDDFDEEEEEEDDDDDESDDEPAPRGRAPPKGKARR